MQNAPLPDSLRSTAELLRGAYPNGVSVEEFAIVVYFLAKFGDMSTRGVSMVLGEINKQDYPSLLHSVDRIINGSWGVIPEYEALLPSMCDKLRPHGLVEWLEENA